MSEEIKECPFCGRSNPSTYKDEYYVIQCPKCGAMVCDSNYLPVDRWNTRTSVSLEARNAELVEAVHSLIATLEPAVNYTGVQVVWSPQDRQWTKEHIAKVREIMEGII